MMETVKVEPGVFDVSEDGVILARVFEHQGRYWIATESATSLAEAIGCFDKAVQSEVLDRVDRLQNELASTKRELEIMHAERTKKQKILDQLERHDADLLERFEAKSLLAELGYRLGLSGQKSESKKRTSRNPVRKSAKAKAASESCRKREEALASTASDRRRRKR